MGYTTIYKQTNPINPLSITSCQHQTLFRAHQFGLGQMTRDAVAEQVSRQLHGHLTYFLPAGGSAIGYSDRTQPSTQRRASQHFYGLLIQSVAGCVGLSQALYSPLHLAVCRTVITLRQISLHYSLQYLYNTGTTIIYIILNYTNLAKCV